jgi:hypothetical protein
VNGWIGVDLDGTLAEYGEWQGPEHIGAPVAPMVERVKRWLEEGQQVRIFTARASGPRTFAVRYAIDQWCKTHLGVKLPITNEKDYEMIELWDDRCVQVVPNTGQRADGLP